MSDERADADRPVPERSGADEGDALVSRVRLIEERPIEERAEAFAQLHDELQRELEGR
ncbi:hypothetical protein [Arenivirga flava]|uniref:Uncharacterized protein n=1 Tax=Arenivirga flava TaxID=1930060 RepID=A0AA37X9V6_9MICO|nr:hypothetical protein [Arenivirga flava]GMA27133.1 hypothetical protein GCM10025874_03860 [Arenivirga flava]